MCALHLLCNQNQCAKFLKKTKKEVEEHQEKSNGKGVHVCGVDAPPHTPISRPFPFLLRVTLNLQA